MQQIALLAVLAYPIRRVVEFLSEPRASEVGNEMIEYIRVALFEREG